MLARGDGGGGGRAVWWRKAGGVEEGKGMGTQRTHVFSAEGPRRPLLRLAVGSWAGAAEEGREPLYLLFIL